MLRLLRRAFIANATCNSDIDKWGVFDHIGVMELKLPYVLDGVAITDIDKFNGELADHLSSLIRDYEEEMGNALQSFSSWGLDLLSLDDHNDGRGFLMGAIGLLYLNKCIALIHKYHPDLKIEEIIHKDDSCLRFRPRQTE